MTGLPSFLASLASTFLAMAPLHAAGSLDALFANPPAAAHPTECMTVISFLIQPDKSRTFLCDANIADMHGEKIRPYGRGKDAVLLDWEKFADFATWSLAIAQPGTYEVIARVSSARAENEFAVEIAGQHLEGRAPKTASWEEFVEVKLGRVQIKEPGQLTLAARPSGAAAKWKAIRLASVVLKPAK